MTHERESKMGDKIRASDVVADPRSAIPDPHSYRSPHGGSRGVTLIEVLIVVIITAMLILAVEPLIRTTYQSWMAADRRAELIGIGRVGMNKMVDEIRTAYDLYSTDTTYIDYYPMWATSAFYRFNYKSSDELEYGRATAAFTPNSLAYPIDTFTFYQYDRRMDQGATTTRRTNAIKFLLKVSDERQVLINTPAAGLNPMSFLSMAHLRESREGYQFSNRIDFRNEIYVYHWLVAANDCFCVKVFSDRMDPANAPTAVATIFGAGPAWTRRMTLLPFTAETSDYFAGCCRVRTGLSDATCGFAAGATNCCDPNPPNTCGLNKNTVTNVDITVDDFVTFENFTLRDQIQVVN